MTEDIPFRTFTEGLPGALKPELLLYKTRNTVIEQLVLKMMEKQSEDLRKDWEVAKARVGASNVGKSLEDFARGYLKWRIKPN